MKFLAALIITLFFNNAALAELPDEAYQEMRDNAQYKLVIDVEKISQNPSNKMCSLTCRVYGMINKILRQPAGRELDTKAPIQFDMKCTPCQKREICIGGGRTFDTNILNHVKTITGYYNDASIEQLYGAGNPPLKQADLGRFTELSCGLKPCISHAPRACLLK